jgi:predicted aspartyl protease
LIRLLPYLLVPCAFYLGWQFGQHQQPPANASPTQAGPQQEPVAQASNSAPTQAATLSLVDMFEHAYQHKNYRQALQLANILPANTLEQLPWRWWYIESLYQTGDIAAAFRYLLQFAAPQSGQPQKAIADAVISSYLQTLSSYDQIDVYQQLLDWLPEHVPYSLALANVYIQLEQPERAEQILLYLGDAAEYQSQITALWHQIDPPAGEHNIDVVKVGNQFAVDVMIDGDEPARLLIDTGASMTALAQDRFSYLLNSYHHDAIRMRTANGVVTTPRLVLNQLFINDILFEQLAVALIPMPSGKGIDGLLGMDILGQLNYQFSEDKKHLQLSRKKTP